MRAPCRLLSFDTSTSAVHLCLQDGGKPVAGCILEPAGGNRQETAALLLPGIDKILKESGWLKSDISCLVVGAGPGSFTGVRVGVVTARTIAQALNLPLLSVSILECLAIEASAPVAAILSGAVDHYFIAAYEDNGSSLRPTVAPSYVNLSALQELLAPVAYWVADEAARVTLSRYHPGCGSLPVIKNIAMTQAQIAWNRLSLKAPALSQAQALADEFPWSKVEPLYLRGASVTIKKSHGDSNKTHEPR